MRAGSETFENGFGGRAFHDLVGRTACEQRLQGHGVQSVAGTISAIEADDRGPRQREIADRIERLVADELVRIAQTFGIDDDVVLDGDGVLERGPERVARLPQPLDVAYKSEGPSPRDVPAEGGRIQVERAALAADGRRLEIDLDVEAEAAIGRQKFGVAAVAFDA